MKIQSLSGLFLTVAMIGGAFACAVAGVGSAVEPSSAAAGPSLSRATPLSGAVGAPVTLQGSGFAAENNVVKFGAGYIRSIPSPDGTTLRFTVPDGLDLCPPDSTGPCQGAYPRVIPGEYTVAVISKGETSNKVTFTVTRE